MLIEQNTFDWVRCSGWRDGPSCGNQVRETLCYFMDFYLTRLPLLGGLILRTPSSDGLGGLPVRRPESLVGVKFPTLLVFGMFLAAVGAFLAGLTGCLGWGSNNRHSRCLCGGKELLKHGHHVFHLLHVLCLKHIRNLGNYHGLSLGVREFFPPSPCLRCLF
jgi:hypothetical protein